MSRRKNQSMRISYTMFFKLSKSNRLIFQEQPPKQEIDSKTEKPKSEEELKREHNKAKEETHKTSKESIKGSGIDALSKAQAEQIKELNRKLSENIGKYLSSFEKVKDNPALKETIENIRRKAESDEISISELQGGNEWLGVEDYEEKYSKLARAYLEVSQNKNGETVFKVKEELDRNDKVKYNLGAGHMLPPSIQFVAIKGGGETKKGVRKSPPESPDGRIGYYDENNQYIPVYAGYTIQPVKFLHEKSEDYKKALEHEKQIYLNRKEAEKTAFAATYNESGDLAAYRKENPNIGYTNYPVSTTQSLRHTSKPELQKYFGKERQTEVAKVLEAQKDMLKTEAILESFGIATDANSEIDGALHYVNLSGKASEMLGWTSEKDSEQKQLLNKLKDKKYIQESIKNLKEGEDLLLPEGLKVTKNPAAEDGFEFKTKNGQTIDNLEKWTIKQVTQSLRDNPNSTIELIKVLSGGNTLDRQIAGYTFKGSYTFDIAHLKTLHEIGKNSVELGKTLKELDKGNKVIDARDFIKKLFRENISENLKLKGLSLEEAQDYARRHGLDFLLQGGTDLQRIVRMSEKHSPFYLKHGYRFDALRRHKDFPFVYQGKPGNKCCAWTVSTYLGLGGPENEEKVGRGKQGNVSNLLAKTVRSNIEATGKAGIVIGFENFQKGDLLAFNSPKKRSTLIHIAMVRDVINIDGEKFLAIQHDCADIQVDLIPVNKRSHAAARLRRKLADPAGRAAYRQKYPQLDSIYNYRGSHPETVHVQANAGNWYGDASKGSGNILFAVRTAGLMPQGALA